MWRGQLSSVMTNHIDPDRLRFIEAMILSEAPMTDLPGRLEKLRFLIEELMLCFAISQAAPSTWDARLAARHILVRANDFIVHSRQLRRPVRLYGSDVTFHQKKETYAVWFAEYFQTVRDRLGAHVQDLDFGLRIDLWNDVDAAKIGVFVEGAIEIYDSLAGLSLPGYVSLPEAPQELNDPAFAAALDTFRNSGVAPRAEFASDSLGMTRPGTASGSGFTPIHERASQLTLIARWVDWDLALLERFGSFPRVRRIFASRLVTDVLSYADCLVTRPLPASAPQAMSGLNDLMAGEKEGPSPTFVMFLTGYRFHQTADSFRPIRNEVGGHLEIDSSVPLADILVRLDAMDGSQLERFFLTMHDAFRTACRERIYLTSYLADGQRIRGGVPNRTDSVTSFGGTQTDAHPQLVPVRDWTNEDVEQAIDIALGPDEVAADIALDVVVDTLRLNDGEEFTVEHSSGGSTRWDYDRFTLGHQVVLRGLLEPVTPERAFGLLAILRQAGRSWPSRTAETLIRYQEAGGPLAFTPLFMRILAGVMQLDVARFANPVISAAKVGQPWPIRREAVLGLFRAFVREEGARRINYRENFIDLTAEMDRLLVAFSRIEEIELRMAMTSVVWDLDLSFMASKFEDDLRIMRERLLALVSDDLIAADRHDGIDIATRVINNQEMVGLAVHLALPSKGTDYRELLKSVRDGHISVADHVSAAKNLVKCLWLLDDKGGALSVATRLAQRNPGDADHELLQLEILSNIPGNREEVLVGAARVRRDFELTTEQESRVEALRSDPGS